MEAITEGVTNLAISEAHKKNRIQVSNTKKPLFFYVNLAKRYMQQHNEVELSALGMDVFFKVEKPHHHHTPYPSYMGSGVMDYGSVWKMTGKCEKNGSLKISRVICR